MKDLFNYLSFLLFTFLRIMLKKNDYPLKILKFTFETPFNKLFNFL